MKPPKKTIDVKPDQPTQLGVYLPFFDLLGSVSHPPCRMKVSDDMASTYLLTPSVIVDTLRQIVTNSGNVFANIGTALKLPIVLLITLCLYGLARYGVPDTNNEFLPVILGALLPTALAVFVGGIIYSVAKNNQIRKEYFKSYSTYFYVIWIFNLSVFSLIQTFPERFISADSIFSAGILTYLGSFDLIENYSEIVASFLIAAITCTILALLKRHRNETLSNLVFSLVLVVTISALIFYFSIFTLKN
jgi:hypothetical protein